MIRTFPVLMLTALLAACASRPALDVVVAPPPPIAAPVYAMPAGTYPGMPVPALLADGSYATPNRALSPAGMVWHLRAGLNFAALACRGPAETSIIAGYNAMLAQHRPLLKQAEATLAGEYRATGGAQWRDSYDDSMTRLYNYYALSAARPALCATADRLLAEAASVPPANFTDFAAARLPELDAAFTQIFRAYDAWRTQSRPAFAAPSYAASTVAAPIPSPTQATPTYAIAANASVGRAVRGPWIEVDPAVLRMP